MENTVTEVPSPWDLDGNAYWFLYTNSASTPLSEGHYDPHEKIAADGSEGVFKGGLASVLVYRYKNSPVGPYDELLIVPGKFTNPINGEEHLRISRIYVSTEASVYNGMSIFFVSGLCF